MLSIETSSTILLLTGIALELCGCVLVMTIAVRLRAESDFRVCEYLLILDYFGVFDLSLM